MKSRLRILVVEDETAAAMFLETFLKEDGHEVLPTVASGEEAVESAARDHPDLILMDVRLAGGMDGFTAAEQIVSRRPVPIVFMTGYVDETIEKQAMKFKPAGYLTKPFSFTEVQKIIERSEPQKSEGSS